MVYLKYKPTGVIYVFGDTAGANRSEWEVVSKSEYDAYYSEKHKQVLQEKIVDLEKRVKALEDNRDPPKSNS